MSYRRLSAFLAAAVLTVAPVFAASPGEVLDAYRAATGGDAWNGKAVLQMEYDVSAYGLTGTVHVLTDLPTGRNIVSYKLGPVTGANGYDGTDAWDMDSSGTVTLQQGGDVKELTANGIYRDTGAWWRPDRGGANLVATEKTEDGNSFDVVTITPPGGKPFDAWFDKGSRLLVRIVEMHGPKRSITHLSDYAEYDGVKLPRAIVTDTGDGEKYIQKQTLTKAGFLPPQPDSAYAPPKTEVHDFDIAAGATQTSLPFRLINNHIYGEVKINGKGPFTAIFDTGGVNLVTPTLAEKLGIKIEGKLPGSGAGEGIMEGGFGHADRIDVAGAAVRNQTIIILPLDKMNDVEGMPMPAMIGYETFRRFVTRIDYGAGTITLIDPKAFAPKDAGTAIPFTFYNNHPEVMGTFEGLPAKFDIDTGARNDLTLNKPFVERNDLIAKHPKGVHTVDGWGVGGKSTGYATRGAEMTIGPVKIDNFVVSMADQAKGAFAGDEYQGNIGGGILKRFVVTFDYGNKIMYLKPLAHPPGEIGTYDRAGMWINRAPEGFVVAHVTVGGPAERAGILKDDVIVAVNGKKATAIALSDFRAKLRTTKPGTVMKLGIERNGKPITVSVTLRDLI